MHSRIMAKYRSNRSLNTNQPWGNIMNFTLRWQSCGFVIMDLDAHSCFMLFARGTSLLKGGNVSRTVQAEPQRFFKKNHVRYRIPQRLTG